MDWDLKIIVISLAFIIAVAILILLVVLIRLAGKILVLQKKPAGTKPAPQLPAAATSGIDDETVAVISAAVSCYMSETAGTAYKIASITRAAQRPVWGFAGMQQNTRPF